jgi:hypothetical protein
MDMKVKINTSRSTPRMRVHQEQLDTCKRENATRKTCKCYATNSIGPNYKRILVEVLKPCSQGGHLGI